MNSNIWELAKAEFNNTIKSLYIKIGLGFSILFVLLWLVRLPSSFDVNQYLIQYFFVVKFVLILASVNALGRDFKFNTYKYLFTGCYGINKIVLSKILSVVMVGIVCWLLQFILKIVIVFWINKEIVCNKIFNYELLNTFVIYLVIATLMGSFAILITSIFLKFNITFISTLFVFGIVQFYAPIFILNFEKNEILPFWFHFIKILPVYIIFDWIETFNFQITQLALMLIYSIFNLYVSIIILNKRNLNS